MTAELGTILGLNAIVVLSVVGLAWCVGRVEGGWSGSSVRSSGFKPTWTVCGKTSRQSCCDCRPRPNRVSDN